MAGGGSLAQFRTRALACLDFAGHDRDLAVGADVNASRHSTRALAAASASPLRQRGSGSHGNQQSGAEELNEGTAVEPEVITDLLDRLCKTVGFDFRFDTLVHRKKALKSDLAGLP